MSLEKHRHTECSRLGLGRSPIGGAPELLFFNFEQFGMLVVFLRDNLHIFVREI